MVDSVRRIVPGSILVTALAVSDDILEVENCSDFQEPDEDVPTMTVLVNGQELAYRAVLRRDDPDDGVTVDTLVLESASPIAADLGTRVDVPDVVRYEALVFINDMVTPVPVKLRHGLAKSMHLRRDVTGGLNVPVRVEEDDRGMLRVVDIDLRDPNDDGRSIADSTLPSTSVDLPNWVANAAPTAFLNADGAHHPDLNITGGRFSTSTDDSGLQRVVTDDQGTRLLGVDGKPLVTFPTAPNARAHVEALVDAPSFTTETGSVTQQFDVSAGATFALKESTQAPVTPPIAALSWDLLPIPGMDAGDIGGVVHDGTDWWILLWNNPDNNIWLARIDVTDGVGSVDFTYPLTGYSNYAYNNQALALIGGTFYVLLRQPPGALFTIISIDASDGSIDPGYAYTRRTTAAVADLALGQDDADHLLVAEPTFDLTKVVALTPASGISFSTTTLPALPGSGARTLAGIQHGTYDLGSSRYVLWAEGELHRKVLVAKADLSDWDEDHNFRFAGNQAPLCSCWADSVGRWASVPNAFDSGIYTYGIEPFDGTGVPVYVTTSLHNDTHGYDTPVGPMATLQGQRRAGIRVNAGTLPGSGGATDPEYYQAWYTTHDPDTAAPADWSYLGDCDASTGDLAVLDLTYGFEGSPAANTFPAGPPAELASDDGTALIRADKTGLIFDLIAAAGTGGVSDDNWYIDELTGDITIEAT